MAEVDILPVGDALVRRGITRVAVERGINAAVVSRIFGVNPGTLSRMLSGSRRAWPPPRAAAALGVTVPCLLAACAWCAYEPPSGYTCQRCGSRRSLTEELGLTENQLKTAIAALVRQAQRTIDISQASW